MRSPASRRSPRILIAAAAMAAGVALFGAASPAAAHDQLLSSDPAAGASVEALPAQLTLSFSAELLGDGGGNEMQVTDAAGQILTDGPTEVDGTMLVQALTGEASGEVTVLWRAVSSDGHPISGEFAFTVAGTPATVASPTAAESTAPSPSATATDAVASGPTATTDPTADADASDAASPLPWIIVGLVIVLAVAVIVVLLLTRSRQGRGPDDEGSAGGSTPVAGR